MREVVDGVVCDTRGAQFVAGYRKRRGSGTGGGGAAAAGGRIESGAMYVMEASGKKRIFMVERPLTGEAVVGPIDAGTARVVLEEWRVRGCITEEAAGLAAATLDMMAPVEALRERPANPSGGGAGGAGGGDGNSGKTDAGSGDAAAAAEEEGATSPC